MCAQLVVNPFHTYNRGGLMMSRVLTKQSGGLFVPGEGPGHWPGAACKAGA